MLELQQTHTHSYCQSLVVSVYSVARGGSHPGTSVAAEGLRSQPVSPAVILLM